MRLFGKTSISLVAIFAIAVEIANAPASAQSPKPATSTATIAATQAPASPAAAATGRPQATAAQVTTGPNAPAVQPPTAADVISYLSAVITWYRHLGVEAQLVRDPDETLYFADDRQTASEILRLAFEYARAQAALLAKLNGSNAGAAPPPGTISADVGLGNVTQTYKSLEAAANTLGIRIKDLNAQLAKAPARQRAQISSNIASVQSDLDLNRARQDALKALAQFESNSATEQGGGLAGQIDELERSISDNSKHPPPLEPIATPTAEPSGILSLITDLISLQAKVESLEQNGALAKSLAERAAAVRKSVLALSAILDARAKALAQGAGGADVAALKDRKAAFEDLLVEHKLTIASALPLSKQIVLLGIYTNNIARWRGAVQQRWKNEFRHLLIRVIGLAAALLLVFLGGLGWRWITNRYVKDIRRRGQVMAARRFVLGVIIVIVVMANFADELGSAATVLGFAAAGIAVALQNVILSVAGYFFLIGRFGIKVGDRVQISGVFGDVIDIGLVKLSLMELGGSGAHREPTGRVVVFSNAIVFQPSGNFFKQAPGTSFVWNEVRLTLAPDVDYRLAEKRLLDAVDEVYARYRERVIGDYRHLERVLNVLLDTPKPQSRLQLGPSGLEITIRYPAEIYSAAAIADEVSRRVLDAINREPSLRLAAAGVANIEAQVPPPAPADGQPPDSNGDASAQASDAEAPEKPVGSAPAHK